MKERSQQFIRSRVLGIAGKTKLVQLVFLKKGQFSNQHLFFVLHQVAILRNFFFRRFWIQKGKSLEKLGFDGAKSQKKIEKR